MHLKNRYVRNTDNKNTEKAFSICELLSFNQASFSSYPPQILILQFPIPRAFLPPSPFLSNLPILSNVIRPRATTGIGHSKPDTNPS